MATPRATARALLITFVLAWQGCESLPVIRSGSVEQIERNRAERRELERWHRMARSVGIRMSKQELAERWVSTMTGLRSVRNTLLAPMAPFKQATHTGQGWGLFAVVDEHPQRLVVELVVDGQLTDHYRRSQMEPQPLRGLLRNRRLRAFMSFPPKRPRVMKVCEWAARGVLDRHPEAQAVVVRREEIHTTRPGEPPDHAVRNREFCRIDRESP